MKNKHLTLQDRSEIECRLLSGQSFAKIGEALGKNKTTISREVKNHYIVKNSGAFGRKFNNCLHRKNCPNRHKNCHLNQCPQFSEEKCPALSTPPYVCNGCSKLNQCTLTKHCYQAVYAQQEYKSIGSEARSGVNVDPSEVEYLNSLLVPLIKEQGQSIHQAIINNRNKMLYSEKTIYKWIDLGLLEVRNIDLPRKVRFRQRKKTTKGYKVDKQCLVGRTYEDYLNYLKDHPDTSIVQMDTVEGRKGGKVLLTIHFVNCSFMLAFLRDHNDAQSVIDIFNALQEKLGIETFRKLFPVILTDNGTEFSNPKEIEEDPKTKEKRTKIFYCHPSSPYEKGACEVNHELLRRPFPKGTSFDDLTQEDVNLVMSHINSYGRKKLNDECPISLFSAIYGKDTLDILGIQEIKPNQINLSKTLLKK